jgi:predicted type IV restriction endonuclease
VAINNIAHYYFSSKEETMDFIDRLRELSTRIPKQLDHIQTEEATRNAFVMPFLSALGYNVFDPTEVTPELNADIGVKKGEKVDYAILRDGSIILWDIASHQPIGQLSRQTNRIWSLAFSMDGAMLASTGGDNNVILWDVNFESWKAQACDIANRTLTSAEWNQFIGADIPYVSTCPRTC